MVGYPVPITPDCSASLMPLPGLPLGAEIECPVCKRRVAVREPPPEGFCDPWSGSPHNRISPHWSQKWPEGAPGS